MKTVLDQELSKRPIKALDQDDLVKAERAAIRLRTEIEESRRLEKAWSSPDGKLIQEDILKEQRKLERDAMEIPLTDLNRIAVTRGMWKALDELAFRHIHKKGEAARKEGLLAEIIRRASELAERLKSKVTKSRG